MSADRLHASLEVPFKHNRCDSRQCVQGPFKAYQPALATTLLNGHYKSKESEKEIICQELRIGRKETLSEDYWGLFQLCARYFAPTAVEWTTFRYK